MFYKKLDFDKLLDKNEDEKQVIDLLVNENAQLKLIWIRKNDGFNSKISHTDVFIYIVDGELEIIFPKESKCHCYICGCDKPDEDINDEKKYIIKKNQMFMFEKEVLHNVKAIKDCKFILVKITRN